VIAKIIDEKKWQKMLWVGVNGKAQNSSIGKSQQRSLKENDHIFGLLNSQ
jgi:hypothetical protein